MRKQLSEEAIFGIDSYLYTLVMLKIESKYNVINNYDGTSKIFIRDRKKLIKEIGKEITDFANKYEEDIDDVKDYLFGLIDSSEKLRPMFIQEYKLARKVVLSAASIDEER